MSIELAIIVLILLIVFFCVMPAAERFNSNYYDSSLEKDMDYIKDNKGYTLDDFILSDHAVYGKGIDSPF